MPTRDVVSGERSLANTANIPGHSPAAACYFFPINERLLSFGHRSSTSLCSLEMNPMNPAPSLWQEARNADGRVYYYNVQTKATQWAKPEELMTPIEASPNPSQPIV